MIQKMNIAEMNEIVDRLYYTLDVTDVDARRFAHNVSQDEWMGFPVLTRVTIKGKLQELGEAGDREAADLMNKLHEWDGGTFRL